MPHLKWSDIFLTARRTQLLLAIDVTLFHVFIEDNSEMFGLALGARQ